MKTFLLLSLFLCFSLQAKVLLVSDIDDTIKVSNVLDKSSAAINAMMVKNVFIGMPDLYQRISNRTQAKVFYLSNAPGFLLDNLHQSFLRGNKFPGGELMTRSFSEISTGSNHKLNSLRKLIQEYRPSLIILIGDNGEKDPAVYGQIVRDFPEISFYSFIRQAYTGKQLEQDQIPFASSIDIAAVLFEARILNMKDYTDHVVSTIPSILAEDNYRERGHPIAFPLWYDCRDFKMGPLPLPGRLTAQELILDYVEKVNDRCSRGPYHD